mgnify:CR=1 FL=1
MAEVIFEKYYDWAKSLMQKANSKKKPITLNYLKNILGEDGSGDMEIYPEPDLNRPMLQFHGLKAYDNAPPEVKRVLSLEFGRRRDINALVQEEYRYVIFT